MYHRIVTKMKLLEINNTIAYIISENSESKLSPLMFSLFKNKFTLKPFHLIIVRIVTDEDLYQNVYKHGLFLN